MQFFPQFVGPAEDKQEQQVWKRLFEPEAAAEATVIFLKLQHLLQSPG